MFVWHPDPLNSALGNGLGWKETLTPHSSAIRMSKYLATVRWSPMLIPAHGPTWNSHDDGATDYNINKSQLIVYNNTLTNLQH